MNVIRANQDHEGKTYNMLKKPPLFILGCPRSGTTLLSDLMADTCYGAPIETHFITKYYKKLDRYGDIRKKNNCRRLVENILSERPVKQWRINFDFEQFWRGLREFSYRELINELLMIRFGGMGKSTWGDKTPHYILELEIIYNLFPNSKYIFIVRDGRDVALSLLKKPWGPNNVYACGRYWAACNQNNAILETMRRKMQIFETSYEHLLYLPDEVMRQAYKFLGESYDETVMSKKISAIKPKNFNKWKTEMTKKQVSLFERVAGNTLLRFGYETSSEEAPITHLAQSIWQIHDNAIQFARLVKMNTIDALQIKYLGKEPFAD